tara:strand:- start:4034 stop:4552 length:519 start_codon:yes stop_codon:yes gene_type:complete
MPIYAFKGTETGRVTEWFGSYKDKPEALYDPDTGEKFEPQLSAPNLLNSNLADWQRGLSGFGDYDRHLGQVVYGEKHRDEILKARNLVRESDMPKNWVADTHEKGMANNAKLDKESDEFFDAMKEYGLDKQGEDTGDRLKRTEKFWDTVAPAGDIMRNPEKYNVQPKGETNA